MKKKENIHSEKNSQAKYSKNNLIKIYQQFYLKKKLGYISYNKMTVSYQAQVATSNFNCFLKLLARWRGSIYKIIWMDLAVFLVLYYALGITYRFLMGPEQQR